jgi:hypothetical protein
MMLRCSSLLAPQSMTAAGSHRTQVSLFGLVTSGALVPAITFVMRHPTSFMDMSLLSIAATTGQLIILYTIKEFGALLFATIMTTRQFLSCAPPTRGPHAVH